MKITFNSHSLKNFDEAYRREWLETNGLGGWASSTLSGAHSRRYHGLLVAATQPPVGRMVLLSKLDETLVVNGQRLELGCNRYPNALHPRGFEFLRRFEKELFPLFEYQAGGVRLRKTIAAVNGENTTLVLYEALEAAGPFTLELQPFVAYRDYHSLAHANEAIRQEGFFQEGIFRVRPYEGLPELFIAVPGAFYEARPAWYYRLEYGVEQYRGLGFQEDLFTYGVFRLELEKGDRLGVIISTENPSGGPGRRRDAFQLFAMEEERRRELLKGIAPEDDFTRLLTLAADQFVVKRGEDLRTIIAGYHWFGDWGRDTMIALPGICLATGRYDDAKKILRAFAQSVDMGMLPNRFPDREETPEYNTVDATLWFFVAIYQYWEATGDEAFVRRELLPVLQNIIAWHDHGARYGIHTDRDGLLLAGEPGVQLTWMDAKIGDWVVTPRDGKAVEINALWYNALEILAELSQRFGAPEAANEYRKRAGQVKERFNEVFWSKEHQYLFDYVKGEHRDASLRPNQVFALSLPFPLLDKPRAQAVLRAVSEHLLTPVGLRSLAPGHPDYRPHYGGDAWSRDSAYHQGTVWAWLLGPYITALLRYRGAEGRKQAQAIFKDLAAHLSDAGAGSISEIFDADPPFAPRGCIAQAWSVGEVLRAYNAWRLEQSAERGEHSAGRIEQSTEYGEQSAMSTAPGA